MSGTLEVVIGVVGIIVFTLVFMAGISLVQDAQDRETADGSPQKV